MTISIEWFGCTTFRIHVEDKTLFFDAYLDKIPGVAPSDISAIDVERADFLFISHAHFDHIYGADTIAKATGATVVGNYETARIMSICRVPKSQIIATAGGDVVDCGAGVRVRALPAQHACLFATTTLDSKQTCLGDLGVSVQQRRLREGSFLERLSTVSPEATTYFLTAAGRTSQWDGGQLAYMLETSGGSLLFSASAGYWTGIFDSLRPDIAILAAGGRPNVDGEPYQGSLSDFLVEQAELLGRPRVILCHHDPLLPPIMNGVDVSAAEDRLRDLLGGDRYLQLSYNSPVEELA